jgi:hypothetical protein
MNNLNVNQIDFIKSIAVFYLFIFTNLLLSLFTCHQVHFIQNNSFIIKIAAFLIFFFLITNITDSGALQFVPPIQKLIYSLFYFCIFLLSTRLDISIMITIVVIIFILFFIELNKKYYLELNKNIKIDDDKITYDGYSQFWITLDNPYRIRLLKIQPSHFDVINQLEYVLYIIGRLLLIVGFIAYGGEMRDLFSKNKNISWTDIFNNTKNCDLKETKSLFYYFKRGLNL